MRDWRVSSKVYQPWPCRHFGTMLVMAAVCVAGRGAAVTQLGASSRCRVSLCGEQASAPKEIH